MKMALYEEVEWDELVFVLMENIGICGGLYSHPKLIQKIWRKKIFDST
jgi:pyruvate/2-oxoglutarate/acetoin dehydrogenase E1 component